MDDEKEQMRKFTNRSYPLDKATRHHAWLGLVDVILAYVYDVRTTEGEHNLEHPHTVPADGAVGVEVEGHQAFWTCDSKPFISVLTTVPPHTDSLGVSTKTKAGLVTEDDPLPF
ncbi:hypothetical protein NFI96_003543 [Prochilodus magdalenae]|nr:hypothetical protein NFI96_003543 [Prochilodus magdalenae]